MNLILLWLYRYLNIVSSLVKYTFRHLFDYTSVTFHITVSSAFTGVLNSQHGYTQNHLTGIKATSTKYI